MPNNLKAPRIGQGQTNKEVWFVNALGAYDAALTAPIALEVDAPTYTLPPYLWRQGLALVVTNNAGDNLTITVPAGLRPRGLFIVVNTDPDFGIDFQVQDQVPAAVHIDPDKAALLWADGSSVRQLSAGVPTPPDPPGAFGTITDGGQFIGTLA